MRTLFFLFCLLNASSLFAAQPPKKEPENSPSNKALKPQSDSKNAIDWGDWDKKFQPQQRYGVGIKGKLQNAISELDKSNLLNDTSGVSSTPKTPTDKNKKRKDIKKMKQELKALEEKVKQEIESDEDY